MHSNAQKIKSSYKKLMNDGKKHSRKELFDYARNDNPETNYSEGMLTGALKTLTDPGTGYYCVERGIYQKENSKNNEELQEQEVDVISEYHMILKETLEAVNQISVNPMVILEYDDHKRKKLEQIQKCIQMIQKTIKQAEL